jgi:hypothetical protein
MFMHQQVTIVDDEKFQQLVMFITAILIVSLLINGFLAADPASVKGPPVKIHGYFDAHGRPIPGYYSAAPGALPESGQPAGILSLRAQPVP